MLVELANILRRHGRFDEALRLLDNVDDARRSAGSELAAYACAVAVHLAAQDYESARKVSESARVRATDALLMRALASKHLKLFHETGGSVHLDEAFTCLQLAALEDAVTISTTPCGLMYW
jgi:hypothetical protein